MRLPLLLGLALTLAAVSRGAPSGYLGTALSQLGSDVPRGWAYTVTTTRKGETTVERYDPSAATGEQWTLALRNGQAPTDDEIKMYRGYKAANASSMRATFQRGDIDAAHAQLLREDEVRVEYRCSFREDLDDPMLKHMMIDLTVAKQPSLVEKCILQLKEPFSPVIGIKTVELRVEMTFSAPTAERPSLPLTSVSHYRGRLLLFLSVEEDVQVAYSDFIKSGSSPNQNPPQ